MTDQAPTPYAGPERVLSGVQPTAENVPVFRPFMLAYPLEDATVSLDDYLAEWKWDGILVQLVHAGGETRLYSRAGDDITGSFPDVAEAFAQEGVLDGELLVKGEAQGGALESGGAASFNALQQRLGGVPASLRLNDMVDPRFTVIAAQPAAAG